MSRGASSIIELEEDDLDDLGGAGPASKKRRTSEVEGAEESGGRRASERLAKV